MIKDKKVQKSPKGPKKVIKKDPKMKIESGKLGSGDGVSAKKAKLQNEKPEKKPQQKTVPTKLGNGDVASEGKAKPQNKKELKQKLESKKNVAGEGITAKKTPPQKKKPKQKLESEKAVAGKGITAKKAKLQTKKELEQNLDMEEMESDETETDEDVFVKKAKLQSKKKPKQKIDTKQAESDETETDEHVPEEEATPQKQKAGMKRKADREIAEGSVKRSRNISEIDKKLVEENNVRLRDQKNRSLYVALPGKQCTVSDSALKALHPDILTVNRLAHAAFFIFDSQAVRDKAIPILEKAQVNNKPIRVDPCGETSAKGGKPKKSTEFSMNQLVVSDLPNGTTQNMLEIVFPKAAGVKIDKDRRNATVSFEEESETIEAFKKGKALKISSVPVTVRFRYV